MHTPSLFAAAVAVAAAAVQAQGLGGLLRSDLGAQKPLFDTGAAGHDIPQGANNDTGLDGQGPVSCASCEVSPAPKMDVINYVCLRNLTSDDISCRLHFFS